MSRATIEKFEADMNKMFDESVGSDLDKLLYKPKTSTRGRSKSSGSSQGKHAPGTMANGTDFYAEMRKQISALVEKQRSGG